MKHTQLAALTRSCLLTATLGRTKLCADTRAERVQSALESDAAGWTDILPQADLKGWTRIPIPASGKLGRDQWHVDADTKALVCDGDGGHEWLRYDRELGDAIFHVEWRFTPREGKTGYNSGVYIRNSADGSIWHQAQVGSKSGGFYFGDTPIGGKIQRINLAKETKEQRVKEAGEWNTYELTARRKLLTLWVNGATTSEFAECELQKGYIGLEAEGWRIEFRNVKLKELK